MSNYDAELQINEVAMVQSLDPLSRISAAD